MAQKNNQIVIAIKICSGCKSHQWCTRHDEKKYEAIYQQVKSAIEKNNAGVKVEKYLVGGSKIGAFEISSDGKLFYSKLDCGYFPLTVAISGKISRYVQDKKDGKDTQSYHIHSQQARMRKSNDKYYDKLVKSGVQKSPKKDKLQTSSPLKSSNFYAASPQTSAKVVQSKKAQEKKKEQLKKSENSKKKEEKSSSKVNDKISNNEQVQEKKKSEQKIEEPKSNKKIQPKIEQKKPQVKQQKKAQVKSQKKIQTQVKKVEQKAIQTRKWISKIADGKYQTTSK